jgi:uncharacterized protein
MITRTPYLEKVLPFVGKKLIKVLMGIRRSGKTVLLQQISEHIIRSGIPTENIISLNFESLTNISLTDAQSLYSHIMSKAKEKTGTMYLFLDEIQEVTHWEKAVASLLVDLDCDIYITGSNSNLLSSELATYIAGRYVHFNVYPFTFSEILDYSKQNGSSQTKKELFLEYLSLGGLPQRLCFSEQQSAKVYLDDVYNTIILKDIIGRNKLKDIDLLQQILDFLMDNVGNTFSAQAITRFFKSEGRHVSVDTILNYIEFIKRAQIIETAKRYDVKGKKLLSTQEKYFAMDLGLRNIRKNSANVDYSNLLENAVFLEMLFRGYKVHVGKLQDKEVDFICYKGTEIIYLQVSYLLANEETIEREFAVFKEIKDNFPKYVLSLDEVDFSRNGIRHQNVMDFLLSKT